MIGLSLILTSAALLIIVKVGDSIKPKRLFASESDKLSFNQDCQKQQIITNNTAKNFDKFMNCRYFYRKNAKIKHMKFFLATLFLLKLASSYSLAILQALLVYLWSVKKKWIYFYKCQNLRLNLQFIQRRGQMKRRIQLQREGPNLQQTELYDKITKIEVQILQKIQKLKATCKNYSCEHFNIASPDCQPFDQNANYYDKFWKRFLLNEIGKQNVLQFREQIEGFARKIEKIDNLFQQWEKVVEPVARSKRRGERIQEGEQEICPYCERAYQDKQTLLIHVKIKHHQGKSKSAVGRSKSELDIFQSENSL